MVVGVAVGRGALDVVVFLLADVELTADNRLHASLVRRIHEMHRAEDVAVVGHGNGGHSELVDVLDQLLDVASAIEHGVVGVQMQMYEVRHDQDGNKYVTTILTSRGWARRSSNGAELDYYRFPKTTSSFSLF